MNGVIATPNGYPRSHQKIGLRINKPPRCTASVLQAVGVDRCDFAHAAMTVTVAITVKSGIAADFADFAISHPLISDDGESYSAEMCSRRDRLALLPSSRRQM
jgi:hypothetical protein